MPTTKCTTVHTSMRFLAALAALQVVGDQMSLKSWQPRASAYTISNRNSSYKFPVKWPRFGAHEFTNKREPCIL